MPRRPTRLRTVIDSVNDADGSHCVDIFQRADDTWGFEEYRRDPEDGGKWTVIGHYADRVYASRDAATQAAAKCALWLGARLLARGGT